MADAETTDTSSTGGYLDKALIIMMIAFVAFPFSAITPLLTYDDHVTTDGTIEELTGKIGIFDASTGCRYWDTTVNAWQFCNREDVLKTNTETTIGNLATCEMSERYGTSVDCGDDRHDWCMANHGLGISTLSLLVILFVLTMMRKTFEKYNDVIYMVIYVSIGAFSFSIFGLAASYAESDSNDCGFNEADVVGDTDYFGYGELGIGSWFFAAVGLISMLRFMSILFNMMNVTLPSRGFFYIYVLIFSLVMAANFTPIVTQTDVITTGNHVHKTIIYPFRMSNNTNANSDTNHEFMRLGGTCEFDFGQDTTCSYKNWCHETHVSLIWISVVSGLAAVYAWFSDAVAEKVSALTPKRVNGSMMFMIAVLSIMHSVWTMYLIGEPLDLTPTNTDDDKCGFDHVNGLDGTGPSVGLVSSIAIISTTCLMLVYYTDSDGFINIPSRKYKLIL